jgi:hypothetical protein
MAKLKIHKVYVYDEQEGSGDELYFKIDGKHKGGVSHSVETGDTWYSNISYNFTGKTQIKLFEDDWGFWDPDDHIATKTIYDTPGTGKVTYMDGDGGMYDVHYSVYA